ncbi:hypothetical protein ASC97_16415 [Rhizobium sp. Root1203]|nr:hypothetical protein ASC97_16415 [Rhizobium sp. Root1203]
MGSRSDKPLVSPGLAAALEHFPAQAQRIEDLFESDESFRGICEDLADAEATLKQIARLPDDVRDARRSEYRELVKGLSGEIEEAISRAKIIPLRRARRPPDFR